MPYINGSSHASTVFARPHSQFRLGSFVFFCSMSERYTWNVTKLSIELAPKRTVLADERWMWRAGGRNAAVKFCVVRRRGQESGDPACVSFTDRRCWVLYRSSLCCARCFVYSPPCPLPQVCGIFFSSCLNMQQKFVKTQANVPVFPFE